MPPLKQIVNTELSDASMFNQYRDLFRGGFIHDVVNGYGADPTGVSDSTSILQEAFTAAATTGRKVSLPGGTYSITATLTIPEGVTEVGGPGTIKVADGANIAGPAILVNATECTFKDFILDGNKANQTDGGEWTGEGINIPASGTRWRNVTVKNTSGAGLSCPSSYNVGGPDDIEIEGCKFFDIGKAGRTNAPDISVSGVVGFRIVHCRFSGSNNVCASTYESSQGVISNNRMVNPANTGVFGVATGGGTTPAHDITIECNVIDWSGTAGGSNHIDWADSSNVSVKGNICKGPGGGIANLGPSYKTAVVGNVLENSGAIYIGATTPEAGGPTSQNVNATVQGNVVEGAANSGIMLQGANNVSCTGNTVMNSSQAAGEAGWYGGIWVDGGNDITISGNRCGDDQVTKTQGYGLVVDSTSGATSGIVVGDNNFRGNLTGAINDTSTAGSVILGTNAT